jgi:hypothetical protein
MVSLAEDAKKSNSEDRKIAARDSLQAGRLKETASGYSRLQVNRYIEYCRDELKIHNDR